MKLMDTVQTWLLEHGVGKPKHEAHDDRRVSDDDPAERRRRREKELAQEAYIRRIEDELRNIEAGGLRW